MGLGSVVMYSAYFVCGEGISEANSAILEALMLHSRALSLPWLIGADWNMEVLDLMRTEFCHHALSYFSQRPQ